MSEQTAPAHILLVEDEQHIAKAVVFNLEQEDYRVSHVVSAEEALGILEQDPPELLILDLMLPGMSGFEFCRLLRKSWPQLPILMLTAMTGKEELIQGLSEGADDYLTKPFNLEEFLLRVRALLRRSRWGKQAVEETTLKIGESEIFFGKRIARTPRGEVSLTDLEVRMLRIFAARPGELISRAELLSSVWGMNPQTETRTLDNFIVRLRKYFETDPSRPKHFITLRGRGYRFDP